MCDDYLIFIYNSVFVVWNNSVVFDDIDAKRDSYFRENNSTFNVKSGLSE